jgi:hypothetical protein
MGLLPWAECDVPILGIASLQIERMIRRGSQRERVQHRGVLQREEEESIQR